MIVDHQALQGLLEADSFCTLTDKASDIAHGLGFEHFIYGARMQLGCCRAKDTVLNGYPPSWRRAYVENNYIERDPTVLHCLESNLPLVWTEDYFVKNKAEELMEHARQFGVRGGVTLPSHSSRMRVGMLSLATEDETSTERIDLARLAHVRLFADYLHEGLQRLLTLNAARTAVDGQLSPRETECLTWAGAGKTSWEIGRILALSERTVNFHFGNAMRKLGVTTRSHAMARVLALGLIRP